MAQAFEYRLKIQGIQTSWIYTIPIGQRPIIIGRQPGVDLLLEHTRVSGRHAALRCTADECQIVDLSSTNGTRLNGQKLTPQVPVVLKPGDSIQIGGFDLVFEMIPIKVLADPKKTEQPRAAPVKEELAPKTRQPEVPPPPPPRLPTEISGFDPSQPPPGLTFRSDRLLNYLPGIYHTEFMSNYLAIFESILFPIEWQVDGFDLFVHPGTAPASFIPWLAQWFEFTFDSTWSEARQRDFLKEAYSIYSRCGTPWALSRVLEIYTGYRPEIDDQAEDLPPYTFRIKLPKGISLDRSHIERLINTFKPVHTSYILEIER